MIALSEKHTFERDKKAYKRILQKWLEKNLDEITERKWEIEEIQYLTEVSDFIKLIREAETLYELGFYTSCIALIGVSAEDFSKYLSLKMGYNNQITLTQFYRLKKQLEEGIIDQTTYDFLDYIRKIRNDCLHYNQDFKRKDNNELKSDAIKSLNNLKATLKIILGLSEKNDPDDFLKVMITIATSNTEDSKNFDETKMKIRNATSHLLDFPTAFDPNEQLVIKNDHFQIVEIDFENSEITLISIVATPGAYVIVELSDSEKEHIQKLNLSKNDTIFAIIISQPNQFGMSEEWNFINLWRINNFGEIPHNMSS